MLSDAAIGAVLADLVTAYGEPWGSRAEGADRTLRVWSDALSGCELEDVQEAAREYRRTGKRFPAPAAIREIATGRRAARVRAQEAARREAERRRELEIEPADPAFVAEQMAALRDRLGIDT